MVESFYQYKRNGALYHCMMKDDGTLNWYNFKKGVLKVDVFDCERQRRDYDDAGTFVLLTDKTLTEWKEEKDDAENRLVHSSSPRW